jgi:predicted RNA-binding protein with EMAP domain
MTRVGFFVKKLSSLAAVRSFSTALPKVSRVADALQSLDRWKREALGRLDSLNYDGLHERSVHVVDRFYDSYFDLERRDIEENSEAVATCCEGKVSIHCAKTSAEDSVRGTEILD